MKPKWFLWVLAFCLLLGLGFFAFRKREPSYQGRSLSSWLTGISGTPAERQASMDAIRAMGEPALPFLASWAATTPNFFETRYMHFYYRLYWNSAIPANPANPRQSSWLLRMLPDPGNVRTRVYNRKGFAVLVL